MAHTTKITLNDHLAEYCIAKWGCSDNNAVRFPPFTDVYRTISDLTRKRPADCGIDTGNIEIILPTHDSNGDMIRKNPEVYNYIYPEAAKIINRKIGMMFWDEVHETLMSEKSRKGVFFIDSAYSFINKYEITSITSDALIKNFKRYRDRVNPREVRDYRRKK